MIRRAANPTPYAEVVDRVSAEYSVPKEIIYAVMKTESGFEADATSYRGARGLMQIMPDTFTWLVEIRKDERPLNTDSLYDPEINIEYGVYFLSYLYKRFGDWELVYAAYNAGMNRVAGWLEDSEYSENGRLTDIPIEETAKYVVKASKTAKIYRELYYENN